MASPSFLGDGSTPRRSDTQWVIMQKILGAEIDGLGSGSNGQGQVYMDRDPAAPDNTSKAAISYSSTTGVITQWNTGTLAWV